MKCFNKSNVSVWLAAQALVCVSSVCPQGGHQGEPVALQPWTRHEALRQLRCNPGLAQANPLNLN